MPGLTDKLINRLQVESWKAFFGVADQLDVGRPSAWPYAFRGQADAEWDLIPSFLRYCRRFDLSEQEALRIEAMGLAEFQSEAHLHISTSVLSTTTDTISWWTLMQQHGAPTRTLDWCASIYVACYFAVRGSPDKAGAVWLVHTQSIHEALRNRYKEVELPKSEDEVRGRFLKVGGDPVVLFCERKNKTERMVAQRGVFSICQNVLGDHGQIIGNNLPEQTEPTLFAKLVIAPQLKPEFLRKLRSMNITARSLFPGLDGLGKSIEELFQAAAERGPTAPRQANATA